MPSVAPCVALVHKLVAVLESQEKLPLVTHDTPGAPINLQVCLVCVYVCTYVCTLMVVHCKHPFHATHAVVKPSSECPWSVTLVLMM